jgi:hypothetical protein
VNKKLIQNIQDLMVVLLKSHLQIESNEFCHVAMGKRVLGTENTANLKNTLKVSAHDHLLIELR